MEILKEDTENKDTENPIVTISQDKLDALQEPWPLTPEYFKVDFNTKLVEPLLPKVKERMDEVFGKFGWAIDSKPTAKPKWNGTSMETHVYATLRVEGLPLRHYSTFGVCDFGTSKNAPKIAESNALVRICIMYLNIGNLDYLYTNKLLTPETLKMAQQKQTMKQLIEFPKLEYEVNNPTNK